MRYLLINVWLLLLFRKTTETPIFSLFPMSSEVSSSYNVENVVSQFNLQFCTIVEIGQGYCSLFIEFRADPSCDQITSDNVAEVFLGTCECAAMRNWELCSPSLRKARPSECTFSEGIPKANTSARVHRRLCDPTNMVLENEPCKCRKQFGGRSFFPVTGFLTCFQHPLPKTICSHHSVCGVHACRAKTLFDVHTVQCDPECPGKQPFCEEIGPRTSKAPVITSKWSDWTKPNISCPEDIDIAEAMCLNTKGQPAFDCLGPGSHCCPPNIEDCRCEVNTSSTQMKVIRYLRKSTCTSKKGHFNRRKNGRNKKEDKKKAKETIVIISKEKDKGTFESNEISTTV